MKRHSLSLLLHPIKNRLMPKQALKEAINTFTTNILSIANDYPHLKFNLVLPGYILELIDIIQLSKLRDLFKKGNLEWLLTGYTEPFLSISPFKLTSHNIRHGMQVFSELTGEIPAGFMPPFSNWEPFLIDMLSNTDINYTVLSRELLPPLSRNACGYWIAEHTGSSLALIATNIISPTTAPANFIDWLQKLYAQDTTERSAEKFTAIQYMIPICNTGGSDPYRWLRYAAEELDKYILNYQPVRFSEYISKNPPLGLQYVPSSLLMDHLVQMDLHFLNFLYSYDQIGILQRKLLDVYNKIGEHNDPRLTATLLQELCFVQDIHRLLPAKECGFQIPSDRLWSYSKLIDIEKTIYNKRDIKGGQIRITDFLKNGTKSIILSNKCIKAYIDYTNGGHIFEFDFREKQLNLCAAYSNEQHDPPNIIVAGKSKTWFIDQILPEDCKSSDYINGTVKNQGNFLGGQFEYKVRKLSTGVRIVLERRGSLLKDERNYPLMMEKVFGLDKDDPVFSFVYQLTNPSLVACSFKFATELTFSFPGLGSGDVRILHGAQSFDKLGTEFFSFQDATKWCIEDRSDGTRVSFQTQKPFDIWCLPAQTTDNPGGPSQGITIVLSANILLNPNSNWKNIGKMSIKKLRRKSGDTHAL